MSAIAFAAGNYRTIPAFFQYSSGVMAEPGYAIVRVTFRGPIPLAQGFARAAEIIKAEGRPLTSFCACELRSPGQFTDAGFIAFNELYCETLAAWGIYDKATKANPVARSNVCPEIAGPDAPCLYAFCFTVAGPTTTPTFVISGSGESKPGTGPYSERIVRYGETSADAMLDKARHVLTTLEARMQEFGVGWSAVTGTQAYTVHDPHAFFASEIVARGAARLGLTWHYARPPVQGLEFEMDCRSIAHERVV